MLRDGCPGIDSGHAAGVAIDRGPTPRAVQNPGGHATEADGGSHDFDHRCPHTTRPLDPPASVDAVVPVYNEQGAHAASIRRLQDSLSTEVPFAWRILIADNASTDETPRVTAALTEDLSNGEVVSRSESGRGASSAHRLRAPTPTSSATWSSICQATCGPCFPCSLPWPWVTARRDRDATCVGPRESRAVQSAS
jgi:hypothetical protein